MIQNVTKGAKNICTTLDDSGMQACELCVIGDILVIFFHQSPFQWSHYGRLQRSNTWIFIGRNALYCQVRRNNSIML